MEKDCLFCRIIAGELPSEKIYEDDSIVAIQDISPQAPVHFIVLPKAHIPSAAALTEGDAALVGHVYAVVAGLAEKLGMGRGYRVVTNVGEWGGQTVGHLHFHVLSGRELGWPPG